VEKSKTDPKVLRSLELLLSAFELSLEKDEIKLKDSQSSAEKSVPLEMRLKLSSPFKYSKYFWLGHSFQRSFS